MPSRAAILRRPHGWIGARGDAASLVGFCLFAALTTAACGFIDGPREKLARTAFDFNEGLRWGREGEVVPRVDPAALEGFRRLHAGWGAEIQVSGVEMVRTVVDDKATSASVFVKYTWYRQSEMVVYETVTQQNWQRRKGEWWMTAERLESGKPFSP